MHLSNRCHTMRHYSVLIEKHFLIQNWVETNLWILWHQKVWQFDVELPIYNVDFTRFFSNYILYDCCFVYTFFFPFSLLLFLNLSTRLSRVKWIFFIQFLANALRSYKEESEINLEAHTHIHHTTLLNWKMKQNLNLKLKSKKNCTHSTQTHTHTYIYIFKRITKAEMVSFLSFFYSCIKMQNYLF